MVVGASLLLCLFLPYVILRPRSEPSSSHVCDSDPTTLCTIGKEGSIASNKEKSFWDIDDDELRTKTTTGKMGSVASNEEKSFWNVDDDDELEENAPLGSNRKSESNEVATGDTNYWDTDDAVKDMDYWGGDDVATKASGHPPEIQIGSQEGRLTSQ